MSCIGPEQNAADVNFHDVSLHTILHRLKRFLSFLNL